MAGCRWPDGRDPALRRAARRLHAGRAAALRHGDGPGRLGHRPAGHQRTTAGRSRSRATRCTRRAWARPTRRPRPPSSSCTTRTAAGRSCAPRAGQRDQRELGRVRRVRPRALSDRCTRTAGGACASWPRPTSSPSAGGDAGACWRDALPGPAGTSTKPVSRDNEREGTALLFGAPQRPQLALDRTRLIVSLDADFLLQHPAALRIRPGLRRGRDPDGERLEPAVRRREPLRLTGAAADQRRPGRRVGDPGAGAALGRRAVPAAGRRGCPREAAPLRPVLERALAGHDVPAVPRSAASWRSIAASSLVLAGPRQPAEVHALVHLMNVALGNVGQTVTLHRRPRPGPARAPRARSATLAAEIEAGRGRHAADPRRQPGLRRPGRPRLRRGARRRWERSIHLGLYDDETSRACTWHLPRAHYLESWGDARALRRHLQRRPAADRAAVRRAKPRSSCWPCSSRDETTKRLRDRPARPSGELAGEAGFEKAWRRTLHDGILAGSGLSAGRARAATTRAGPTGPPPGSSGRPRRTAPGDRLPGGPGGLRRPLRQQRLAAGTARPDDQADLGQRGAASRPADGRGAAASQDDDVVRLDAATGRELELPVFVLPGQAAGIGRRARWATAARAAGPGGRRRRASTSTRCAPATRVDCDRG